MRCKYDRKTFSEVRPRFSNLIPLQVVQVLLQLGADVEARRGHDNATALMAATAKNHTLAAEALLLSGGADHLAEDARGNSPRLLIMKETKTMHLERTVVLYFKWFSRDYVTDLQAFHQSFHKSNLKSILPLHSIV